MEYKELEYIPFKVHWKKDEEEESDDLNIREEEEDDDEYTPGVIYWRRDIILGFNAEDDSDACFLITGLTMSGERLQFKVNENIKEVVEKLK